MTPRSEQIERRTFQIEERIVATVLGRDQQRRRKTALAARHARLEQRIAVRIGLLRSATLRYCGRRAAPPCRPFARRAGERMDIDMHAVIAGMRGQARDPKR